VKRRAQAQRPAGTNCRLPCVTAVTCCVDNTNKGDRALQKGVLKRKGQPAQTAGFRVSRLSHAALTTQTRETEPCEKACSSAKATRHKLQTYAGGHSFRTFYVTNIVMKRDTGTQGTQQIHTAESADLRGSQLSYVLCYKQSYEEGHRHTGDTANTHGRNRKMANSSCPARGIVLQRFVQTYHRLLSAFWHFYNQCLFNSFRQVIWLECESKVCVWVLRSTQVLLRLMWGAGMHPFSFHSLFCSCTSRLMVCVQAKVPRVVKYDLPGVVTAVAAWQQRFHFLNG